jgi:hypothetical protein
MDDYPELSGDEESAPMPVDPAVVYVTVAGSCLIEVLAEMYDITAPTSVFMDQYEALYLAERFSQRFFDALLKIEDRKGLS